MSYYEPKKVFVKTENGAYTEITYQEFCKRRNADPSYKKRFFIPIQGSLLEVNEDTYRDFYQAKEREDYVDECRQDVGEISYETLQDSVNDYKTVDEPHEELVRRTKYVKMWKCFAELSEDDRQAVSRARKIQKYLSQPFFVTADSTGYAPRYVPIDKTVKAFGEIISGSLDHIPEQYFFMKGDLDDVLKAYHDDNNGTN